MEDLPKIVEDMLLRELRPSQVATTLFGQGPFPIRALSKREKRRYHRRWWWVNHKPHFHLGSCEGDY